MNVRDVHDRSRVAVIGHSGFIGSSLVPALVADGCRVTTFGSRDEVVAKDGQLVAAIAESDAIVYLATRLNPRVAEERPDLVDAELREFERFVRALPPADRQRALVVPSSGGTVYDTRHDPPFDERAPTHGATRYAATKLRIEELATGLAPSDCHVAVLRIANVYGPGQRAGTGQGVIAHWLEAAANGREALLYGPPDATRDYVYVDDVVAALIAAVDAPPGVGIVNIGSGHGTSLATLAVVVREVVGERFQVAEAPSRGFDLTHNYLDVGRAAHILGWGPSVDLERGIAMTWAASSAAAATSSR